MSCSPPTLHKNEIQKTNLTGTKALLVRFVDQT